MNAIPVLLVTYNRLEYSKQALASIIKQPSCAVEITIWDNGSTEVGYTGFTMQEWLSAAEKYLDAVVEAVRSPKNVGLAPAMNYFFNKYKDAPYVVKVDNDTILPDNWLADLVEVMEFANHNTPGMRLGAISGTCVRPPGLTAAAWYGAMKRIPFKDHTLYFNPACLGTGVLINMNMIRERGLLFEKFPRAPGAGPDDPCLISGWGAYIQEASAYTDWKFLMYSKVPVRLLNLKEDQVLSNDYPEYDAEVKKVRDEGNAWWESVGGIAGVRQYVQDHGGLEPIAGYETLKRMHDFYTRPVKAAGIFRTEWLSDESGSRRYFPATQTRLLTEADNLAYRATEEFWVKRIAEHGARASTFLSTPQARINEFTERHVEILRQYAPGKDVLDVGCGWGRLSYQVAQMAKSYIGTDFMPELIAKAKESLPDLDFRVADAKHLPLEDGQFDIVMAATCLSSFAGVFEQVLPELKRVLRPGGFIVFLEEDFVRIDWKLENA